MNNEIEVSEIELSCLYCDVIETFNSDDCPRSVLYFCCQSCQDAYHSEMDPNNVVASEEG